MNPPPSKAAKILRRTGVGLSLGAVAITFLVLGTQSRDGAVIAIGATPLALGAAWEVSRMGKLAGRGLVYVLLAPVLCSVFLCWDFVRHAAIHKQVGQAVVHANLLAEAVLAVVLALLGWVLVRAMQMRRMWSAGYPIGAGIALVLVAYVVATGFYQVSREVRVVGLVVGLLGLAAMANTLIGASRRDRRDLAWALGLALWIALPLTWLWHVWDRFEGAGLVALVVLSKVGDIAAYYGGNAFGKHHPLPNLSPGKTVEGFACSVAAGLVTGAIMTLVGALDGSVGAGLLGGLVVNVASQAGDLLESWVKRSVGVKDSSNLFGPSGGVLDVVDSLLLATPVALLVWPALFSGGGPAVGV